jgi:acetylglutamate kinase
VGLSGRDAGLVSARLEPGLGRVGFPYSVNAGVLHTLWTAGLLPVVSPVSDGPSGESINVNADEAALCLATAVKASALVYLSDVDGVRLSGGFAEALAADDAARLIVDGTISGGMALKVRAALDAARAGIPEVVIAGKARLTGGFAGTRIAGPVVAQARA